MTVRMERETWVTEDAKIKRVADLLGGSRVFRDRPRHTLDVHDLLRRGLPREALTALFANISVLTDQNCELALGVSRRTLQRFRAAPGKPLSNEQSGRAWKFAEILSKATEVFGSQQEAEQWLERPAMGLDRRRPIDLLATPAGVKLVEDFLGQMEYGVYV